MKDYLVVIPYCDLADHTVLFWLGRVAAETWQEARNQAEDFCHDEELLLRELVEAEDVEGPNFLEEYGLAVGDPYVLDADRFLDSASEIPTRRSQ